MWQFGGVPGYREWVRGAVDEFNAAHGDIAIELEMRDWDAQRECLISATIVGEGPDIITVHHKYAVEFGQLGGLVPLEQFVDFDEAARRFFPNTLEQVAFEDKHYGIPVLMLPFVLAVNTDLMNKYEQNIPETWDDFLSMGRDLKENEVFAFTMPGGLNLDTAYRFLPLLYKAGGRVFNEDESAAAFNGPAGVAALSFLQQMLREEYLPPACAAYRFDENAALWASGRAAISLEGPWWQDVVADNYGFDLAKLALAPVPGPRELLEENPSRTLLDVVMVSITGYTDVPEEAWEVMKALYVEHPIWQQPDPAMGGLPTQKTAFTPGRESRYVSLDVLASQGQVGIGWPGHPAITEIQRHIADAVNMVLSGEMEPQAALDVAAAEVNELLNDY
jgi:multiple sugar transport system substrate-binding protein